MADTLGLTTEVDRIEFEVTQLPVEHDEVDTLDKRAHRLGLLWTDAAAGFEAVDKKVKQIVAHSPRTKVSTDADVMNLKHLIALTRGLEFELGLLHNIANEAQQVLDAGALNEISVHALTRIVDEARTLPHPESAVGQIAELEKMLPQTIEGSPPWWAPVVAVGNTPARVQRWNPTLPHDGHVVDNLHPDRLIHAQTIQKTVHNIKGGPYTGHAGFSTATGEPRHHLGENTADAYIAGPRRTVADSRRTVFPSASDY